jgi:hypothetical protein
MTSHALFVRALLASHARFQRSLLVAQGCFAGAWLAFLSTDRRHALDQTFYSRDQMYRSAEWNRRGLFDWERKMLDEHFAARRHILVLAAGGGREMLALHHRDVTVDGFECNPDLVSYANDFLQGETVQRTVRLAPRDSCPALDRSYEAAIIGWAAYMLIRGRDQRIGLLRQLGRHLQVGAPVLVSFFARNGTDGRFRAAAVVGNALSRITRGTPVEVGDDLAPNYVHYFTRDEIDSEARAAGFELAHFAAAPYGHAVLRASGDLISTPAGRPGPPTTEPPPQA